MCHQFSRPRKRNCRFHETLRKTSLTNLLTVILFLVLLTFICPIRSEDEDQEEPVAWKPLGEHSTPTGGVVYDGSGTFPDPYTFYWHFVQPGQPLVMKYVLNISNIPAYTRWTDDYLRHQYGKESVEVENGKKENRSQAGLVKLKLAKFIDIYRKSDLYMVHSVPAKMESEISVPSSLYCGGFQHQLHESVVWFSSGDTRSVLHNDNSDNFNCLLDGTKEFILIDKRHKDMVEADGFVHEESYSLVDVDAVDTDKFPGLASAPWTRVVLEKGDCLFIPYKWYHQVNSHEGRNLAVNLWFSHLWWFNQTDCDKFPVDPSTVDKTYADFTHQTSQGQIRMELLAPFSDADTVSKELFLQEVHCTDVQQTLKLFNYMDQDKDTVLSWEELYSCDVAMVAAEFLDCLEGVVPPDELPDMSADLPTKSLHDEL